MLYLTRHGQPYIAGMQLEDPDYPPGNPPLTELGREQSRRLGERLRTMGFDGPIYASPYQRTFETADLIADVVGTTVFPEPAIREFTGSGIFSFQGATLEALRAAFARMDPAARLTHPWWTLEPEVTDETGYRPAVMARVGGFIESVWEQAKESDILLVGHGASIGSAIKYFLDRVPVEQRPCGGHGWNCALTAVRLQPQLAFTCRTCVDHLLPEQVTSNQRTAAEVLADD